MDIGPILPRYIARIIIIFPIELRFGVKALDSPTVAVALNISYDASTDAVFIGGHNGQLSLMLERIKQVLLPEGCVVFNSVSQESQQTFKQEASKQGFTLQPSLHIALNDYNPIEIIKATL